MYANSHHLLNKRMTYLCFVVSAFSNHGFSETQQPIYYSYYPLFLLFSTFLYTYTDNCGCI